MEWQRLVANRPSVAELSSHFQVLYAIHPSCESLTLSHAHLTWNQKPSLFVNNSCHHEEYNLL